MRIGIDKAGRVVLPKAVRDQFGLDAGTVLEVEGADEAIILRPIHEEPSVREKEGLLVISAQVDEDFTNVISRMRDERFDNVTSASSKDR